MSTILSHLEGGVLTLTLNRPEALNALNLAMIADLKAATAKAELADLISGQRPELDFPFLGRR